MAGNERWRNNQDRYGFRDDDRSRWTHEGGFQDFRGGGRTGEYRGGGMTGPRSGRDYGGGYGAEGYGSAYRDYMRGNDERGYGGNDYSRGFYGADQGYRGRQGSDEDMWGYRGDRSGWDRFGDEVSSWFGDTDASRRRERDALQGDEGAQHHRGRGPKGYTRSDDRIREDVCDRLTDDPMVDASEIEISVSNREVTLSGTVDSREAKRRAEDCVERVSGVAHVQNNLRVQQPGMTGQDTAAGAGTSRARGAAAGRRKTGAST